MKFNASNEEMSSGKKWYLEQLKKPKWQKMRLRILEYAEWRCQICGNQQESLEIHHSYYLKGHLPWEYPQGSMIALCHICHRKVEDMKRDPLKAKVDPQSAKERFGAIFAALNRVSK